MREYCKHDITKGTCIHCYEELKQRADRLERETGIRCFAFYES